MTAGTLFTPVSRDSTCAFCPGKHYSLNCTLDVQDRWVKANAERLCYICLRNNHQASKCRKKKKCFKCSRMHHPSLCDGKKVSQGQDSPKGTTSASISVKSEPKTSTNLNPKAKVFDGSPSNPTPALLSPQKSVLMQTAWVEVKFGQKTRRERVVFDSGSHRSFVTTSLFNALRAKNHGSEILSIAPFGSTSTCKNSFSTTQLRILCRDGTYQIVTLAVIPSITCPFYQSPVSTSLLGQFQGLTLADPVSSAGGQVTIDILIGLDHYWDFVDGSVVQIPSGPTAQISRVGWLISGIACSSGGNQSDVCSTLFIGSGNPTLDDQLQTFWNLESIGIMPSKEHIRDDDADAIRQFKDSISFQKDRYSVSFPWKDRGSELPTNEYLAQGRLRGLLRRMSENSSMMQKYDSIIKEQLKLEFIEPVDKSKPPDGVVHYIAHHPVVRESSNTTKIRIVYDASAKGDSHCPSLNESLLKGPDLIGDLFGILMRFRDAPVGITADIGKAFLQVGLNVGDRDCTRFFWVSDVNSPCIKDLVTYRFSRVPFGVISSPYLLNATIRYHLETYGSESVNLVKDNCYVDDVIVSVKDDNSALEFYTEIKGVLREAGMNLREWTTNSMLLRSNLEKEDCTKEGLVKVLGMNWNTITDTLCLRLNLKLDDSSTKRTVLRAISSVFDPLGLVAPVVVRGKMFIQQLWERKLDWDFPLSQDLKSVWDSVFKDLVGLTAISIPRNLNLANNKSLEVHAFADASKGAYAAVIYARIEQVDIYRCDLLCSKTRVCPLKKETLPRLELLAIVLAARLLETVKRCFSHCCDWVVIWSDTQIALHWIQGNKPLKQFVANRVAEMRDYSVETRYVNTRDNPADLPSRGCTVKDLLASSLWWHGPSWLISPNSDWPTWNPFGDFEHNEFTKEIERPTPILTGVYKSQSHVQASPPFDVTVEKHSSRRKLLRVTAWCFRFINALRKTRAGNSALQVEEINLAKHAWDAYVQRQAFSEEIKLLKGNKVNSLIKRLSLFQDANELIRCRGRLDNAMLCYDAKNPKLLPKDHYYTKLTIQYFHDRVIHQGVRHTLVAVRSEYWAPQGRMQIQKAIKNCYICKFWEGVSYASPKSPPLPPSRVTEGPPFTYTGLDYAGPIFMKEGKAWILLFTCAVTRAIHLELTTSLTTYEFLRCLRRFIARRGTPTQIVSDHAKTIKLAKGTLDSIWREVCIDSDTLDYVSEKGIKWTFNVERAPWWGGFFERMAGLVKRALRKAIGKAFLTFAELETQVVEVEAVLNARPLTFVYSNSPEDGKPLTPNDLCGPKAVTGFPVIPCDPNDPSVIPSGGESSKALTKRVQYNQKVLKNFWTIWRNEYLSQLKEHITKVKIAKSGKGLTCHSGDIVLVHDDLSRAKWKLGIVKEPIVGKDGYIRAAVIKVGGSILKRPVQLLYPIRDIVFS